MFHILRSRSVPYIGRFLTDIFLDQPLCGDVSKSICPFMKTVYASSVYASRLDTNSSFYVPKNLFTSALNDGKELKPTMAKNLSV